MAQEIMREQEAFQVLWDAFGKIDLQKVRRAMYALGQHRAFVTYAHHEQLLQMVGTLQQLQSVFQQMGLEP